MQVEDNVKKAVTEYEDKKNLYENFTEKLYSLLKELLEENQIEYNVIDKRCKTIKSFQEKITRRDKDYSDPLNEIIDLAGLRIILYCEEDSDLVCDIIKKEFLIDWPNSIDKRQVLQPHEFGYLSVHYVISLNKDRANLTEWKPFNNLKAEIQIRTILQHAWASISHDIAYKQDQDVPKTLLRKLYLLSGLLELADDEFSSLRKKQESLEKEAKKKIESQKDTVEINFLTVAEFLNQFPFIQKVSREAKQLGFWITEKDYYISKLVRQCKDFNISTIQELETELLKADLLYKEYLKKLRSEVGGPWSISLSFLAFLLLLPQKKLSSDFSKRYGWTSVTADKTLEIASSYGFCNNCSRIDTLYTCINCNIGYCAQCFDFVSKFCKKCSHIKIS